MYKAYTRSLLYDLSASLYIVHIQTIDMNFTKGPFWPLENSYVI